MSFKTFHSVFCLLLLCRSGLCAVAEPLPALPKPVFGGLETKAWTHVKGGNAAILENMSTTIGTDKRQVLKLSYTGGDAKKVMIKLDGNWAATPTGRIGLNVYCPAEKNPSIALELSVTKDQILSESKPHTLTKGWNVVEFPLDKEWKIPNTNGQFSEPAIRPGEITSIKILIQNETLNGELFFYGMQIYDQTNDIVTARKTFTATTKSALRAAESLITQLEKAEDYRKDPSAKGLMPKVRALVAKMYEASKVDEVPGKPKGNELVQLKTELFMVLQDAKFRTLYNDNDPIKIAQSAVKSYQTTRLRNPVADLTPQEQELLKKADAMAAAFVPEQPKKSNVEPNNEVAKPVNEEVLRKQALVEANFMEYRRKLVAADAEYEAAAAKAKTLSVELELKRTTLMAAQKKSQTLRDAAAALKGDAMAAANRKADDAYTEEQKLDEQFRETKSRYQPFENAASNAKSTIRNICLNMQAEAKRDPYAKKLLDDPAKKVPAEAKWTIKAAKVVFLKNGTRIEANQVEDLGGILTITSTDGVTTDVDKRDVLKIEDGK